MGNPQTSFLAIAVAAARRQGAEDRTVSHQAIFSIVLGIGLTLMKLMEATAVFGMVAKALEKSSSPIDACLRQTKRNVLLLKIFCVLLVAALLYATAKLAAIWFCEGALLNLTGCVRLD